MNWRNALWYVAMMLILLWVWQDIFVQARVQTILYSDFKQYVARGEVVECDVKDTEVVGLIRPKSAVVAANVKQPIDPKASESVAESVPPAATVNPEKPTPGNSPASSTPAKQGCDSAAFR